MAQLRITEGKGLGLTFDNGITISIQIGGGNYGDNYDFPIGGITRDNPLPPSSRAEIAVWDSDGKWLDFEHDQVKGYVPVEDVFRFAAFLQSLPGDLTISEVQIACKAFDWREKQDA